MHTDTVWIHEHVTDHFATDHFAFLPGSLSCRVTAEKARQIEALAQATDRPRSWVLEQAVDAFLAANAWQLDHMRQGLAELDGGELVPHEEVSTRIGGWGTAAEWSAPQG